MRKILKKLGGTKKAMTPFDGMKLTRAPKGFPAEHPAMDLILQRQWGVHATLPGEAALEPGLMVEIVGRFKLAYPIVELLNAPILPKAKAPLF